MDRVELKRLKIKNFRNLERLELEPNRRFNIISGHNGMGKTNLLEAIYLLGALRSFRTSTRAELLRYDTATASIEGTFGGAAAGLVCEISLGHDKRRVRVDGKAISTSGGHFRSLPMVLFHPATMGLVQSGPDARRRFLDRALFQADPGYPSLHRDYGRALVSRNRALKQSPVDQRTLDSFDPQLAELGAAMITKRAELVNALLPRFEEACNQIGAGLAGAIEYKPKVRGGRDELGEALKKRLPLDAARGYTSVGPHTDDLQIHLGGHAARKFASQGQQRMIALSLKIAETNTLAEAAGRIPLLLLDDISSELDRERNRKLFEFLDGVGGQVFITTTHLDHILIGSDRCDFAVENGVVAQ